MGDAIECTLRDNLGNSLRDDLDDKIEKRPCMIGSENEVLSPALTKHVLIWIVPNIPVVHSCNSVFSRTHVPFSDDVRTNHDRSYKKSDCSTNFELKISLDLLRFPYTLIDYSN